jgi:hypothetical protein
MKAGRPQEQDGPTRNQPVRLSATRRARWGRLAAVWGVDLSAAIRRAVDDACDRERVS